MIFQHSLPSHSAFLSASLWKDAVWTYVCGCLRGYAWYQFVGDYTTLGTLTWLDRVLMCLFLFLVCSYLRHPVRRQKNVNMQITVGTTDFRVTMP